MHYLYTVLPYFGKRKQVTYHLNLLLMFSYVTQCVFPPSQILCINSHPAKRYVSRDVRVQILIWFQTFFALHKPHFQTFNAVWMHWKAHVFRYFRLFQTFSHTHRCFHTPVLSKTSWCSIDVSGNDRHILLFYKKFHFCHLFPFAKVGQYSLKASPF